MKEAAREALARLYRWVDDELARLGPRCEWSGRCCDFPRSGLTLFATRLEIEWLTERCGPVPIPERDGWCPWYRQQLCQAREGRPLGCRLYFCDESKAGELEELSVRAHAALRRLHEVTDQPYRYGPFLEQLGGPERERCRAREAGGPGPLR